MTDPSAARMKYLRNLGAGLDGDFLRERIHLLSELLVELDQLTGAKKYGRAPQWLTRANLGDAGGRD